MAQLHSPSFKDALKQELVHLGHHELPLQRGLSKGNFVTDDPISAMIISVNELENSVQVKAGIFYQGILSGCSCADDPTPTSPSNEYCVVQLEINKATAVASVTLLDE
ncbi:MAG: hypothetical protein ABL860_08300 [Candidatus Nitrotoga sp.]